VGNVFYDPAQKETYSNSMADKVTDGRWYGGTPLWVLAEQQGMRAASFFWVGSEAEIQGVRPRTT
jgi:Type I phosphodiesterase / nucleotide pyrophosphatase